MWARCSLFCEERLLGVEQVTRKVWFHIPDTGICLFFSQPPWSEQPDSEGFSFTATGISISSSHTFFTCLITASGAWDIFLVPMADVQSFTFFFSSRGTPVYPDPGYPGCVTKNSEMSSWLWTQRAFQSSVQYSGGSFVYERKARNLLQSPLLLFLLPELSFLPSGKPHPFIF